MRYVNRFEIPGLVLDGREEVIEARRALKTLKFQSNVDTALTDHLTRQINKAREAEYDPESKVIPGSVPIPESKLTFLAEESEAIVGALEQELQDPSLSVHQKALAAFMIDSYRNSTPVEGTPELTLVNH